jgi:hypothetical protein
MAKARTYRQSATVERPPAYQEYAAAELGAEAVRLMSPGERGLWWSMRAYCWINDSVPLDPAAMARALGFTEAEVIANCTARVLSSFEEADDDKTRLVCPALVRQMDRLMLRREAQAKGGRDAARARREKRNPPLSNRTSNHQATYRSLENSTAEHSTAQTNALLEEKTSTPLQGPQGRAGGNGSGRRVIEP